MEKKKVDWKQEFLNKLKANVKNYKWDCIEYDTVISNNIFGNDSLDEKERVVIKRGGVIRYTLYIMGEEITSKDYEDVKEIYNVIWNMHIEEERKMEEEQERQENERWHCICKKMVTNKKQTKNQK